MVSTVFGRDTFDHSWISRRVNGVINRAGRRSAMVVRATDNDIPVAATSSTLEVRRLRLEPQPMVTREYAEPVASASAFDSSSWGMMDFDDVLENFPRATAVDSSTNTSMVDTQDAMCQTGQPRSTQRTFGVQTPTGEPLLLPAGWSVFAAAEPLQSPRQLANRVSSQQSASLPMAQFNNVELLFEAHAETCRYMVNQVRSYQNQLRAMVKRGQSILELQMAFEIWIHQLYVRPRGYFGSVWESAAAATVTTMERPQQVTSTSRSRLRMARRGRRPTGVRLSITIIHDGRPPSSTSNAYDEQSTVRD